MITDILSILQHLKPDIKVCLWDTDPTQTAGVKVDVEIDGVYIVYNEQELFRPSKEDILNVNINDIIKKDDIVIKTNLELQQEIDLIKEQLLQRNK